MRKRIRNAVVAANVFALVGNPVAALADELPADEPTTDVVENEQPAEVVVEVAVPEPVDVVDVTDPEPVEVAAAVAESVEDYDVAEPVEIAEEAAPEPVEAVEVAEVEEAPAPVAGEGGESVDIDVRGAEAVEVAAPKVESDEYEHVDIAVESNGQDGQGDQGGSQIRNDQNKGENVPTPYVVSDAEYSLATSIANGSREIYEGTKDNTWFDVDGDDLAACNNAVSKTRALVLARQLDPEAALFVQMNHATLYQRVDGGTTQLGVTTPPFLAVHDEAWNQNWQQVGTIDPNAANALRTAIAAAKQAAADEAQDSALGILTACGNKIIELSEDGARQDLPLDDYRRWDENCNLFSIFDQDLGTNGNCTAYSETLKIMVDSSGRSDISAITVMGDAVAAGPQNNGFAAGANHIWNIVTMDDGRNYLVDLHEADKHLEKVTTAEGLRQYLRWAESGSPEEGYVIVWEDGSRHLYRYSDLFAYQLFDRSALVLSTSPYVAAGSSDVNPSPVGPGNSGEPSNPSNPSNPGAPDQPSNPSNPSNPTKPGTPSNPSNPAPSDKPSNPAPADKPADEGQPDAPGNPGKGDAGSKEVSGGHDAKPADDQREENVPIFAEQGEQWDHIDRADSADELVQTGGDEMVVTIAAGVMSVAIAGAVVSRRKMRG